MVLTYVGYFHADGHFIADNSPVTIPAMRRAIINILDDEVIETTTKAQRQSAALNMFLVTLNAIDDEPIDEEFDNIMSRGVSVREVDL